MRMTLRGFVTAIVLVVGSVAPTPSRAQDPVAFGSPFAGGPRRTDRSASTSSEVPDDAAAYHRFNRSPTIRLLPFRPDASVSRHLAALTPKIVNGFDARRYGFTALRVYFDRMTKPEDERSPLASNSTLQLAIELAAAGRPSRWFRLVPSDAERFRDEELLQIDDNASDRETAVPATPDRALPLVKIVYGSSDQGANTHAEVYTVIVLDFRASPRALASLETVSVEGGGACGVWDNQFTVSEEVGCRWDAAKGDFVCAETIHRRDTPWGERRGTHWFHLVSGQTAFPPADRVPGAPRDLAELSARIARDPAAPRSAFLRGLGMTQLLLDLPSARMPQRRLLLFAAGSMEYRLDARFFLVTITSNAAPDVRPVETSVRIPSREPRYRDPSEFADYTPDGEAPTLAASVVDTGSPRVVRVVETEGKGHTVYLVAIDESSSRATADAFLASTDATYYSGCGDEMVPSTSISLQMSNAPFRAALDIEPAHLLDLEGHLGPDRFADAEQLVCPVARTLSWDASERTFHLAGPEATDDCPEAIPRRVEILPDGTIESAGVETDTGEDDGKIQFYAKGSGPAVVLLSDWRATRASWDTTVDALAVTHTVIVPQTTPGHSPSGADWTIAAIAENAMRVIEHLKLDRVVLVGHGMGALTAFEMSRQMPAAIAGVVTVGMKTQAVSLGDDNLKQMLAYVSADADGQRAIVRRRLAPGSSDALVDQVTRTLFMGLAVDATGEALAYASYNTYEALNALRTAKVPIRALQGQTLRGDFPMLQNPEEFNRALSSAIRELEAPK